MSLALRDLMSGRSRGKQTQQVQAFVSRVNVGAKKKKNYSSLDVNVYFIRFFVLKCSYSSFRF